ncbi:SRPBCC family protein [Falsarthrobacter nasiphocae]|uniref:Polyketide cyclase / dehydrase and lipid transport n=1 Tax=Falsarthrobacter nasiphocae TaxID=189863 RepID=A0AAE4C608_9MICC|nr:SRPBCC family protein [Falsarthrobacter nasiphocae]MDR6892058.1 hypothetical protein [Falsarthrobacter nasiphocae]
MSHFEITRMTEIDAPLDRVHALVNTLREWERWSPWQDADPDMRQDYSGPASGEGATMHWAGNAKAGEGIMRIVSSAPHLIQVGLTFLKPFKAENTVAFTLEPLGAGEGAGANGDGTRVMWTMTGEQTWFERLMFRVMSMERRLAADFDKGLARLKAEAEAG